MDNKKILLVNLSKGRTGELNSKLLGMVFVMKFQAAAMSRSDTPEDLRTDFALYVDEFQNFSTDSFATIMSEARKYHLNLIVANQFTTQLTEEIRDAVFGNIGTIVSFRIGQNDVDSLSRYFQPMFDGDDLLRVPNYNSIVRTLVNGVPTQSFSMATLPPLGNPNPGLSDALKQLSAAKYGKPKAVVEKAIFERLATRTPEPKPFQSPFGAPAPGGASAAPSFGGPAPRPATRPGMGTAPAPASNGMPGSGSFLDEWLAKQRANAPAPMLSPARASLPPSNSNAASVDPTFGSKPAFTAPVIDSQPGIVPNPVSQDVFDGGGGNVSSAQLDQLEISDIAQELKKGLKTPESAPMLTVNPEAVPLPVQPAPAPEPAPTPNEGVLHLNNSRVRREPAPDDTIFIDNEGKLHANEPAADAAPQN
jgi:hypothetical protein